MAKACYLVLFLRWQCIAGIEEIDNAPVAKVPCNNSHDGWLVPTTSRRSASSIASRPKTSKAPLTLRQNLS